VSKGALEAVHSLPCHVLVSNVVVACRSGIMDRICWAGNAVNEGVVANPFKMESLQAVVRFIRIGDWMFSFDLSQGYFQIPFKPSLKSLLTCSSGNVISGGMY
jgi:hypothetical protein